MKAKLMLICGLPGAGKTTLAHKLAQETSALLLSQDQWKAALGIDYYADEPGERLINRLKELAWELLEHGQDVIMEFGFWPRVERDELRNRARENNIAVELYFLDVPVEELQRRLTIRNVEGGFGIVPIGHSKLDEYVQVFEPPDSAELALFDKPAVTKKPVRKATPRLTLFCGLPGSGKTTLAKKLEARGEGIRICTDDWQAALGVASAPLHDEFHEKLQKRLYELALELLQKSQDVILEDGLWTKDERIEKLTDAKRFGAIVELHFFDLSFDELWSRLRSRNAKLPYGAVAMSENDLKKCWSIFQRPSGMELNSFDKAIIYSDESPLQ